MKRGIAIGCMILASGVGDSILSMIFCTGCLITALALLNE